MPGGVGGGFQLGGRGELQKHADESDAESCPFGLLRGLGGDEPDGGLAPA